MALRLGEPRRSSRRSRDDTGRRSHPRAFTIGFRTRSRCCSWPPARTTTRRLSSPARRGCTTSSSCATRSGSTASWMPRLGSPSAVGSRSVSGTPRACSDADAAQQARRRGRGEARQAVGALGRAEQVEYMVDTRRWSRSDGARGVSTSSCHRSTITSPIPVHPTLAGRACCGRGGRRCGRAGGDRTHARRLRDAPTRWAVDPPSVTLAQACVLVGDERRAATLYELLSPYADRMAISVSTMPFGPVAMRLGMLATLLERWKEAEEQFGLALDRCRVMGALAFEARVLVEHAAMLITRGGLGDEERAEGLLSQLSRHARARSLGRRGTRRPPAPQASEWRSVVRRRCRSRDVPTRRSVLDDCLRRRDGSAPRPEGAEVHPCAPLRSRPRVARAGACRAAGRQRLGRAHTGRRAEGHAAGGGRGGARSSAKESYRRRLAELAEDLEEARSWNDPERVARIEDEIDDLTTELERALGLGGRDRACLRPPSGPE